MRLWSFFCLRNNASNRSQRKSVRMWSYSGPHFSHIFPHSDWVRRDTDLRAVTYWLFLGSLRSFQTKFKKRYLLTCSVVNLRHNGKKLTCFEKQQKNDPWNKVWQLNSSPLNVQTSKLIFWMDILRVLLISNWCYSLKCPYPQKR